MMGNRQQFIEDNLIILSKQMLDMFFDTRRVADLISLYVFYYYTAKWQKTNQVRATDKFVKKGLRWGDERFRKAYRILAEMGLVERVVRKDAKGKVTAFYVKLNYIWKRENLISDEQTHSPRNPLMGQSTNGKQNTNSLSVHSRNSLNALNRNTLFEEFYNLYPRKKAKKKARESFLKLLKKAKNPAAFAKHIIEAVKSQVEAGMLKKSTYTPYPATWLNQGDWDDDIEYQGDGNGTDEIGRKFATHSEIGETISAEA